MQGFKRKLVYACLFEALAIVFTTFGLAVIAGHDSAHSSAAAVASSTIAFLWNFVFNGLFERWEARQRVRGRNFARRAAHAMPLRLASMMAQFALKVARMFEMSHERGASFDEQRLQIRVLCGRNQRFVDGIQHGFMICDLMIDIGLIELRACQSLQMG